jgi:hypothetical protein
MSKTIWTALHAAKQELGKVPKDSTNPFFKSKYFDINGLLDVAEPILHKHGLFIIQPITNGKVVTKIVHAESGESIESELELSDTKDPQKHGSEITYYRRYTLQSLLAMQADDDDGNAASKAATKPAAPKPTKPELTPTHEKWQGAVKSLADGKVTMEKIEAAYFLSAANRELLISEAANA